jgi:hypothetical protein
VLELCCLRNFLTGIYMNFNDAQMAVRMQRNHHEGDVIRLQFLGPLPLSAAISIILIFSGGSQTRVLKNDAVIYIPNTRNERTVWSCLFFSPSVMSTKLLTGFTLNLVSYTYVHKNLSGEYNFGSYPSERVIVQDCTQRVTGA